MPFDTNTILSTPNNEENFSPALKSMLVSDWINVLAEVSYKRPEGVISSHRYVFFKQLNANKIPGIVLGILHMCICMTLIYKRI